MSRKKYLIIGLASAIALVAAYFLFSGKTKGEEQKPIEAVVKKGIFEVVVTTTGELRAENSQNIMGPDGMREAGIWRAKISDLVPEGTVVQEGDYVASIDKTEITTKLTELKEMVQKAQTQFDKTQLDTAMNLRAARDNLINLRYAMEETQITLEQSKYESPATIRQATISLEKSQRTYQQAVENYRLTEEKNVALMMETSVNLNQANRRLNQLADLVDKFTVKAPKPGMVIYSRDWNGSKRKVGAEISPWDNVIATLPDLSSMVSRTFVNEIDISRIAVNQAVTIGVDAFPTKKFRGKVIEVANIGEELPNSSAKVFEVLIKVFGTDTVLRPAMTTSNSITTGVYEDVIHIPLECVHTTDSLTFVYKKNGGKILRQEVVLGPSNENDVIIENGLAENDRVWLSLPPDTTGHELLRVNRDSTIRKDPANLPEKKEKK
jgi:hypothetical protein